MKPYTLTILLAFIVLAAKGQYHIRVESCSKSDPLAGHIIVYTTNNWKTKKTLKAYNDYMQTYDDYVFINSGGYGDLDNAVKVAKHFPTYKSLLKYENEQYAPYLKIITKRKNSLVAKDIY